MDVFDRGLGAIFVIFQLFVRLTALRLCEENLPLLRQLLQDTVLEQEVHLFLAQAAEQREAHLFIVSTAALFVFIHSQFEALALSVQILLNFFFFFLNTL